MLPVFIFVYLVPFQQQALSVYYVGQQRGNGNVSIVS